MFMSVVLPAPFSPSRACTSPPRTSIVTRSLAVTPGNVLVISLTARRTGALGGTDGTDVMVELNVDRRRPSALLDISRLRELGMWRKQDGTCFLGAGVTYSRIVNHLTMFPALVQASRTVGSPQIRNRGTVGGNLGTASPAGDALPVLAAYDADVVVASADRGERALPWHRFVVGPKRNALDPDELIMGARWRVT